MNLFLSTLLLFVTICSALPTGDKLSAQWEAFKAEFGKYYSSAEEELYRRTVWEASLKYIEEHNAQHERGMKAYRIDGANEFADMTYDEFSEKMLMSPSEVAAANAALVKNTIPWKPSNHERFPYPLFKDWRTDGCVGEIKAQTCGNCYAFAVISVVESHWRLYSGRANPNLIVPLSEQEIVDCSRPQGNNGCQGGLPSASLDYIVAHGRISKSRFYPNEAADNNGCRAPSTPQSFGASIRGYERTSMYNETEMKIAVATKGPVAATLWASEEFQRLRGDGIFNGEGCTSPTAANHAVTIVGYGTLNGVKYWIVRNSWGTGWGNNGYGKIRRMTNACAIGTYPVYWPII